MIKFDVFDVLEDILQLYELLIAFGWWWIKYLLILLLKWRQVNFAFRNAAESEVKNRKACADINIS